MSRPEHLQQALSDPLSRDLLLIHLRLLDLVKELDHGVDLSIAEARILLFKNLTLIFHQVFYLLEHSQCETLFERDRAEEEQGSAEIPARLHQVIS